MSSLWWINRASEASYGEMGMKPKFKHGQTVSPVRNILHSDPDCPIFRTYIKATVVTSLDGIVLIVPHNCGHEMIARERDLVLVQESVNG